MALILGVAKREVLSGAIDNMTVMEFTVTVGGHFVVQGGMRRDRAV